MPLVTQDVARFADDDPEAVVAASFACPVCLHAPCRVTLDDRAAVAVARCTCETCGVPWTVALTAVQILRLSLDPPAAVRLTWESPRHVRDPWLWSDLDD